MKLFKLFLVLVFVFAVTSIAYAETQSVKISGDIAERAFARGNFDLEENDLAADAVVAAAGVGGAESNDWATFLQSTAEVQVAADLTDNVSAVVRLVNQRVWGDSLYASDALATGELGITGNPIRDQVTARGVGPGAMANAVQVDLAYVELKEFLYSPLTLKIGRQDLFFGKGFIIGTNFQDSTNALYAMEYSATTGFDAVRATLDYSPWTIDAVYAKLSENYMKSDDDKDLFGLNVGYVFNEYNAEAEAYYWFRQDSNTGTRIAGTNQISVNTSATSNDVQVLGARGSFDPIEDWTVALEGAYQGGQALAINNQQEKRRRSAWAIDVMAECRYFQDQYAWKPVLNLEYIFYSGQSNMGNAATDTQISGTYHGWDPMYRGKFDTAIREFQNVFYKTSMRSSPSFTNQHQLLVYGTAKPTDDIKVKGTYAYFWLAQPWATESSSGGATPANGLRQIPQNNNKNVGGELDLEVTWDYTEDVSFNLLAGWFFPGNHFSNGDNNVATDIVGSMKLSF